MVRHSNDSPSLLNTPTYLRTQPLHEAMRKDTNDLAFDSTPVLLSGVTARYPKLILVSWNSAVDNDIHK